MHISTHAHSYGPPPSHTYTLYTRLDPLSHTEPFPCLTHHCTGSHAPACTHHTHSTCIHLSYHSVTCVHTYSPRDTHPSHTPFRASLSRSLMDSHHASFLGASRIGPGSVLGAGRQTCETFCSGQQGRCTSGPPGLFLRCHSILLSCAMQGPRAMCSG